jgi:hypothetical protein
VVSVASMTAPVPEENDEPIATDGETTPPGEHDSELPGSGDRTTSAEEQEENAETSLDEPSDGSGGE